MIRNLRPMLTVASVLAALAVFPAGASALTIDPVGNGGHTNAASVVITYSDPNALVGMNCILDSAGPVACSNTSADLGALAEGEHSLMVTGNTMTSGPPCMFWADPPANTICVSWTMMFLPVSASVNFTVDRTAPAVAITSGPVEGSSSTQTTASFGIDAGDGTASCKLDGATVACGATAELSGLTLGAHQFVVSSTDTAGNVGSATRNFTVANAAAPGGKITSAPKSVKIGAKIKLKVVCPDGCKVAVVVKYGKKQTKRTVAVKPGATTATFKVDSKTTRAIKAAFKKGRSVSVKFTVDGGNSKTVKIKKK